MENVILVIHLLLAVSLIGLILLQRSEGGGLGIGGGGGMGSLATAGQTANALTRATAICAACFFTTSIILAILAGTHHKQGSVLDSLDAPAAAVAPVDGAKTDEVAPAPAANDNPEPSEKPADSKPSSTPSNEHGDETPAKLDSAAPSSDKEVPKATDKPEPQTGAPSAPISQ